VLTATVDPLPVPKLVQTQPDGRAEEYRAALRQWTLESALFKEMMWWENSDHPLAHQIAAEFAPGVSAYVFREVAFDSGLGKGYGEALMLERVAHVGIESEYMLKCTGRLSVANLRSVLYTLHSAPDIAVRLSQDLTYVDSRFFLVRSTLLPELISELKSDVNDNRGKYLEHAIARRVLRLAAEGAKIGFWAAVPRFRGQSGSTGKRYDSLKSRVRWPAEALLYRIKRLGTFL
jgi:hypothetical protein